MKDPTKIVHDILRLTGTPVTAAQEQEFLRRRGARFRHVITNVRPEILETLQALKAAYALALVSNADAIDRMHWPESPLSPLFDTAIFSCDVGLLKPDAKIYQLAAQKLGVQPEQCIFVGDGGSDEMAGAKRVGMRTIQARHFVRRDVEGADFTIDRFLDILQILERKIV